MQNIYISYDKETGKITGLNTGDETGLAVALDDVDDLLSGKANPADYLVVSGVLEDKLIKKQKHASTAKELNRLVKVAVVEETSDTAFVTIEQIADDEIEIMFTPWARTSLPITNAVETISGSRYLRYHFCKNANPHELVFSISVPVRELVKSPAVALQVSNIEKLTLFSEQHIPEEFIPWKSQ